MKKHFWTNLKLIFSYSTVSIKLQIEREKYFNIFAGLQEGFPVLTLLTIFYSEKYFNILAGLQEGFPVVTLLTIIYSERETLEREERFWHRAERTVACCRYQGEKHLWET